MRAYFFVQALISLMDCFLDCVIAIKNERISVIYRKGKTLQFTNFTDVGKFEHFIAVNLFLSTLITIKERAHLLKWPFV